jgi:hypothetical protein
MTHPFLSLCVHYCKICTFHPPTGFPPPFPLLTSTKSPPGSCTMFCVIRSSRPGRFPRRGNHWEKKRERFEHCGRFDRRGRIHRALVAMKPAMGYAEDSRISDLARNFVFPHSPLSLWDKVLWFAMCTHQGAATTVSVGSCLLK